MVLFLYLFIAATGPESLPIWTLQCNILTARLTSSKMINITSLMTKHWQFRRTNQAIPGTPENTGLAVRKETVHYYIQKITLSSNNKPYFIWPLSVCWNCLFYQALKVFIIIFTLVELAVRWEWDYISFQKLSDISIHMLYKFFRII